MHRNEKKLPENQKIQWHPGFYAAAELELRQNREELEFHREYILSKKPLQIIVTRELISENHAFLKVLTDKLERIDFFNFMESVNRFTEPGDRRNADAVLQVSVLANKEMYGEIRRSDPAMCDALRELFKDELEDAHESGRTEGRQKEISRLNELYSKLSSEGRGEELLHALGNPEVLEKLYEEFGLI